VTASPNATTLIVGSVTGGSAASLAADDDVYYAVSSNNAGTKAAAWYGSFTEVPNGLANLRLSYTGKNSRACTQTLALYRWTTNSWRVVNTQTVGTTEVAIVDLAPAGTIADYVSGTSGNGELRLRVRCTTTAGTFVTSGDSMRISYDAP
jgi:Ca2+-binding RTX toxin-like protein